MTSRTDSKIGESALPPLAELPQPGTAITPSNPSERCFSKLFVAEWLFRATLRNSLRAWVAAQRSSWLRVPRVLHADYGALRIDYEFLTDWNPLQTVIRHRTFAGLSPPELRRTFWTIGAALEEFHRHTHRIHGDFDFDNILVKRSAKRVAFVDFTPPEYARFRCYNQANPYWDIGTLVLFVRAKYPPQRLHLAFRPQLRELARAFIAGYFCAAPVQYDQRMLASTITELLENTYLGATFSGRYLRRTRLFRTDDLAP